MHPNESIYDDLKEAVQEKFGQPIKYSKDCYALSNSISQTIQTIQTINRRISPTTLKRFFKIIYHKHNPSKYTLDTLSNYVGCADWEHFKDVRKLFLEKNTSDDHWKEFLQVTRGITGYCLESLKEQLKIPYEYTISRKFAEMRFINFLNSDKSATAFIAPSGFGKSIIISKLIERFFIDENALYPNDMVTLFDGKRIPDLLTSSYNDSTLISQIFNFQPQKAYQDYMSNKANMEGRFIIIIDGIDQLSGWFEEADQNEMAQYMYSLISILSSFAKYKWFKVVISCNIDTWKVIIHKIEQVPGLKNWWFRVAWKGSYHELTNVPLLNRKEINQIIQKKNPDDSYEKLQVYYPDLADMIHFPHFLQYYLKHESDNKAIDEIDLLNRFTDETIFHGLYAAEKQHIIESIITESQYGLKRNSVSSSIIKTDVKNIAAYNELISQGILFEYNRIDKYLTFSSFFDYTNDVLFEFFLVNYWLRSSNGLNYELFRKVLEFYQDNIPLQCNILKWLIKYAFKEEKIELLKNIYDLFKDYSILSSDKYFLNLHSHDHLNLIGAEIRTHPRLRSILIPHFASIKRGQQLYFEKFIDIDFLVLQYADNLDHYLRCRKDDRVKIKVHYLKFLKYLLLWDIDGCTREYNGLMEIKMPLDLLPFHAGPFLFSKIIYKTLINKEHDDQVMNEIYAIEKKLKEIRKKDDGSYPFYQATVIEALFMCERHSDIIKYMETQFIQIPINNLDRTNRFHQLALSLYANALLLTGDDDKGTEVFNSVSLSNLSINSKYYSTILYNLVKINFLLHEGNKEKATDLIDWIINISRILGFKFFEEKALIIQEDIQIISKKLNGDSYKINEVLG